MRPMRSALLALVAALLACACFANPALARHGDHRLGRQPASSAFAAAERDDRDGRHGSLGVRPGGDDAHGHVVGLQLDATARRDPRSERCADRAHVQRRRHLQLPLHDPHRDDRLGHGRGARPSSACSCSPGPAASGTTRSRPGITAIQELGAANGFTVVATEDPAQFTDANLATFDVVVFLSTTGEVLNDAQQAAFERYIQGGGGYAGIHAASDTEYTWPWYGELVGGYFRNHPPGTPNAASTSRTATSPPRPVFRPAGTARTSGTTTSTRRPRSSTATRRRPTTARGPGT